MSIKTVLITGVTRGLGLAMAEGFIAAGHQVIGSGRTKKIIKQLAEKYPDHSFSCVDTADWSSVHDWCEQLTKDKSVPDILINNAGIINANAPLWQVPVAEFSDVIDVNIKGVYHVIQQFAPHMIRNGGGVIINFSSGWGRGVAADVAPYCASKWAIEGLSKALAADLPASMVSVALNPGVINTKMLQSCFGEQAAECRSPQEWVQKALPMILDIGVSDNGGSLTVG